MFQEDRKQLQKKIKTMKIKEKYKKIDKDVKLKKKAQVMFVIIACFTCQLKLKLRP